MIGCIDHLLKVAESPDAPIIKMGRQGDLSFVQGGAMRLRMIALAAATVGARLKHGSWLNLVKGFFSKLARSVRVGLARGSQQSHAHSALWVS
jgi:hypothetical protein